MKATPLLLVSLFLLNLHSLGQGQNNVLVFPLSSTLTDTTGTKGMVLLPSGINNGSYQTIALPTSSCSNGGSEDGWHFEKHVGLQFNNKGFIDDEWTISLCYHVDHFDVFSTPYIRLFSWQHEYDTGIFVDPHEPSIFQPWGHALTYSLGFFGWQNGQLGPNWSINSTDYYRLTFTRNAAGLFSAYKNGVLLGTVQDPDSIFRPNQPRDRLTFFQDTINASAPFFFQYPGEAEPGWTAQLKIANYVMTSTEISNLGDCCPSVLDQSAVHLNKTLEDNERLSLYWKLDGQPSQGDQILIEESLNGTGFKEVGAVNVFLEEGNWSKSIRTDGHYLYRIRWRKADGNEVLSQVVEVNIEAQRPKMTYHKGTQQMTLKYLDPERVKDILIQDMSGRVVKQLWTDQGETNINMAPLADGLYILTVSAGGKILLREKWVKSN